MKATDMMDMVEKGQARLIYTDLLLAKTSDGVYVSLDGDVWELVMADILSDEFEK